MSTGNFKEQEREAAIRKAQERKRRRRRKQTVIVLVLILIVAAVTMCVLSLTVFFKIADIRVFGSNMYTAEEIISAAEISIGDNLFRLSGKNISEKLEAKLPFIVDVKINRVLPDTLKVTVTETAEEVCFSNGDSYFSANKTGKIIKEYAQLPENMMMITVSPETVLSPGQEIAFSTEREKELFSKYIAVVDEHGYDVDFINISDPYGSYMKIEGRLIVKFGSSSYFDNKAAYLRASISNMSAHATGVFDLSGWTPENDQTVLAYGDISMYEK